LSAGVVELNVSSCGGQLQPASYDRTPAFTKEPAMLRYALIFLLVALIAGALGMFGLEGTAMQIARILFFIFLVLFVVSLIMGRRPVV
jgi:uncharacterized membrane protein YtjA (UPF0391 family)